MGLGQCDCDYEEDCECTKGNYPRVTEPTISDHQKYYNIVTKVQDRILKLNQQYIVEVTRAASEQNVHFQNVLEAQINILKYAIDEVKPE